jgi:hypothetical protein
VGGVMAALDSLVASTRKSEPAAVAR